VRSQLRSQLVESLNIKLQDLSVHQLLVHPVAGPRGATVVNSSAQFQIVEGLHPNLSEHHVTSFETDNQCFTDHSSRHTPSVKVHSKLLSRRCLRGLAVWDSRNVRLVSQQPMLPHTGGLSTGRP
jgi:hypothetical protein